MIANISVIIPVRNEETNVVNIVSSILQSYNKNILEIILVNDCSTDNTPLVIKTLQNKFRKVKLVTRQSDPGVGLAVREGIKHLSNKSRFVLFMDCDFIINVPDIAKFTTKIDHCDGVVGSRFIKKNSLNNYPLIKLIFNRSYHLLAKLLLGVKNSDLTNNFKLYKRELVDKIYPQLKSKDFAINAELGFYPLLLGAQLSEVSVAWIERTKHMGLSKFKIFRVGPSYGLVFLKLLLAKFSHKFIA